MESGLSLGRRAGARWMLLVALSGAAGADVMAQGAPPPVPAGDTPSAATATPPPGATSSPAASDPDAVPDMPVTRLRPPPDTPAPLSAAPQPAPVPAPADDAAPASATAAPATAPAPEPAIPAPPEPLLATPIDGNVVVRVISPPRTLPVVPKPSGLPVENGDGRYGDLSIPLMLSRPLLQVMLAGATVERDTSPGIRQRWRQQRDGSLVVTSFTRQGLPVTETGLWRIDAEGRYCFSLAWQNGEPENWCHHVVKSDEGYFLVSGTHPDDPVRRIFIDGR